jgi:hypothetical protein
MQSPVISMESWFWCLAPMLLVVVLSVITYFTERTDP